MAKKVSMVQPKPAPPEKITVEKALRLAGNTQPYTVISTKADHWIVHFSGDIKPSSLMFVKGKWTIVKD